MESRGPVYRWGSFSLNVKSTELRNGPVKIRLQPKSLQLLAALLEQAGQVVTREELAERLWPGSRFTGVEGGLNTAAMRLRAALNDSADSPRYIETIPRVGYRFIARLDSPNSTPELASLKSPRRWRLQVAIAVAFAVAIVVSLLVRRPATPARFDQITFRRGTIASARFAPDANRVLYSASWNGGPEKLYQVRISSPEPETLGFPATILEAISTTGELALLSDDFILTRTALTGGVSRVATGVISADWSRKTRELAVARQADGEIRLEYPLGVPRYRTPHPLADVRISPDGGKVAFLEHPLTGNKRGRIMLIDGRQITRAITDYHNNVTGLAWAPGGDELWFTASGVVWRLEPGRAERKIADLPVSARLQDISPNGSFLFVRDAESVEMAGKLAGEVVEHDLSWMDRSGARGITADGSAVLFNETGKGGGGRFSMYLRRIDQQPMRIGEGRALALSEDGSLVAGVDLDDLGTLVIRASNGREVRRISGHGREFQTVRFFPDGDNLLVTLGESGGKTLLCVQPIDGGDARAIRPDLALSDGVASPDGAKIVASDGEGRLRMLSRSGELLQTIYADRKLVPVEWSADNRLLFVREPLPLSATVYQINLATGRREVWRNIFPQDPTAVAIVGKILMTPDAKSYVYSYVRRLSDLYIATGWK
jgi:DNA-binding winged helix-turn-helix (wHTH) protein/WD40 repeat protein